MGLHGIAREFLGGSTPDVVPAVIIIGTLVDPLATVLNSVGNILASMIVSKFVKTEAV